MRDSIKGPTNIQNDYTYHLPLIHQASDFIIAGDQITKTKLSIEEHMVTTPDNSFVS